MLIVIVGDDKSYNNCVNGIIILFFFFLSFNFSPSSYEG